MSRRVAVSIGNLNKLPPYEEALCSAGLEPVRNPGTLSNVSGLVLCGGTDVDPRLYGERRGEHTDEPDTGRDSRETSLIHEALQRDLPVLGICRGIQMLNVALGGTLTQHLETTDLHRVRNGDPARDVHSVRVFSDTLLESITRTGEYRVNSRHHQGINKLGRGLRVCAVCPEDDLVEAVELPDRQFVLAVQWHPEDRHRSAANDQKLFRAFAARLESRTA